MKQTLIATAGLIAALNVSGCALVMGGNDYHGDHGDLVSSDGSVRYVGWCNVHPRNSRCLDTHAPTAGLPSIPVAALAPPEASPDVAELE